jgi:hypothetical protein
MEAARQGRAATVRLLLERGADPGLRDTTLGRTALEIAQRAAKGADPDLYKLLQTDEFRLDADAVFAMIPDVGLPPEAIEWFKSTMREIDPAESYREGADRVAREGDFPETIRLLTPSSTGLAQSTKGNS